MHIAQSAQRVLTVARIYFAPQSLLEARRLVARIVTIGIYIRHNRINSQMRLFLNRTGNTQLKSHAWDLQVLQPLTLYTHGNV